jgi:hypothetical protein
MIAHKLPGKLLEVRGKGGRDKWGERKSLGNLGGLAHICNTVGSTVLPFGKFIAPKRENSSCSFHP